MYRELEWHQAIRRCVRYSWSHWSTADRTPERSKAGAVVLWRIPPVIKEVTKKRSNVDGSCTTRLCVKFCGHFFFTFFARTHYSWSQWLEEELLGPPIQSQVHSLLFQENIFLICAIHIVAYIYIFNLIVGVGALTLPHGFHEAGLVHSLFPIQRKKMTISSLFSQDIGLNLSCCDGAFGVSASLSIFEIFGFISGIVYQFRDC